MCRAEVALFTGVAPEGLRFPDIRNTISLDQEVALRLGGETRFASLALGGGDVSWNRKGVKVPSESRATQVFRQLFIDGTAQEVAREVQRIKTGQSILDGVREQVLNAWVLSEGDVRSEVEEEAAVVAERRGVAPVVGILVVEDR